MIIRSMTATFGKLEGQTLTLEPGLNLITAPNEWGKSTWCAFLLAMLYGIDTKQRTKKDQLADKERYKPWSGKPMEGSMDILWNGRSITIQRGTRGRIPMGEFRAFETDSGLPVPELTAENCGQLLLGVERSVYQRSGFLKGSDLTVTQDEALSRRLNQLVTTGDDSPAGPALEGQLRELKNKCQYNKSGLIPQTEQELQELRSQLEQHQLLENRMENLDRDLEAASCDVAALEGHLAALEAMENREKFRRVEEARQEEARILEDLHQAELRCRDLPTLAQARQTLRLLEELQQQRESLELEAAMMPTEVPPEAPDVFRDLTPRHAMEQAQRDTQQLRSLEARAKGSRGWLLPAAIGALALVGLFLLPGLWKVAAILLALAMTVLYFYTQTRRRKAQKALSAWKVRLRHTYGDREPEELAREYNDLLEAYEIRQAERKARLDHRRTELIRQQAALGTDRRTLEETIHSWNEWEDLQRSAIRATGHRRALEEMAPAVRGEALPETAPLSLSKEETLLRLRKCRERQTSLRSEKDACLGQRRGLRDRLLLESEAERLHTRLGELKKYYTAALWGLEILSRAQSELQSRFAPQITREAGDLLCRMTGGRYTRLCLDEALSLSAAGQEEATARRIQWRSDGTADQMYLALRLAVSRALIPQAPLVLDDALNRFDDQRLREALTLLKQEPRQVILFSCQTREQSALA